MLESKYIFEISEKFPVDMACLFTYTNIFCTDYTRMNREHFFGTLPVWPSAFFLCRICTVRVLQMDKINLINFHSEKIVPNFVMYHLFQIVSQTTINDLRTLTVIFFNKYEWNEYIWSSTWKVIDALSIVLPARPACTCVT